nr:keratin, type I cytoskeletal 18-like [Desmodus rotundus]
MSFSIYSSFSTNHQTQGSVQSSSPCVQPASSMASVYEYAWGLESRSLCPTLSASQRAKSERTWRRRGPRSETGHYFKTIKDLRAQIFGSSVDIAHVVLQIGNACLAADDFRVKYEMELVMHQLVQIDINGLQKLETEIKALKEELHFMKKNHEEEAQYDELAQMNTEDLDKYWSQQTKESTTVVTLQTSVTGAAGMTFTELRHVLQSLEINLDSMRNLKASLENSLRELETSYAMQMEQLNGILPHLESELAQTWAEGQHQAQ